MAMTLVSTVTVGSGGAASIEFTNIPQTGKDLLILLSLRNQGGSGMLRANNVSATNSYSDLRLLGNGSTVSSTTEVSGTTRLYFGVVTDVGLTANTFSNHAVYISNYVSTTSHKPVSADSVAENNATTAYQMIAAGIIKNNDAITSLQIIESGTNVFSQYSSASLYLVS